MVATLVLCPDPLHEAGTPTAQLLGVLVTAFSIEFPSTQQQPFAWGITPLPCPPRQPEAEDWLTKICLKGVPALWYSSYFCTLW